MSHTAPRRLTLIGWLLGLGTSLVVLVRLGGARPGSPPVLRPSEWAAWAAQQHPLDAAAGCVRLLSIALIGYLLVVTALHLGISMRAPGVARRLGGAIAPAFVVALTTAVTTNPAAMARGADDVPTDGPDPASGLGATMELVPTDGTHTPTPSDPRTSLPWARQPAQGDRVSERPTPGEAERTRPGTAIGGHDARRGVWAVQPGEHLWSIAEQVLTEREGRAPDDVTIHRYWVQLIRENLGRLVDAENPDLILPGQRLTLP